MWKLENKGDSATKPAVYVLVEKWALLATAFAYVIATLLNLFLSPLDQWLPFLWSAPHFD